MIKHKIKRAYHHARHTRPRWYHEYHKWEHHSTLHMVTLALSSFVIIMGFANAFILMRDYPLKQSRAATATVTANVTAGALMIFTTESVATLSAVTVNVQTSQNSTGSLGTITIEDNRGSGAGWSSTMTSSHFYKYQSAVMTGGSNNTVTTSVNSTAYTGTAGTYTITITGGGAAGVATYSVTGPGADSNSGTTGTDVNIGTKGLKATFGAATYTVSDSWAIRVDTIPVTGFQVTPGLLTPNFLSDDTNVNEGSQHTFTDTNDPTTLISASSAGGYGMGSYSVTPSLQLTVPAATFANAYTATVTMTVN